MTKNFKARAARRPAGAKGVTSAVVLDHEATVSAQIIILANKITALSSGLLRSQFGIGTNEWRIIALLAIRGTVSPLQMCQIIGIDKAAASRSLKTMQTSGLLNISPLPSNSRHLEVSLTPDGVALHDRIVRIVLRREERMTAGLTAADQTSMLDMLRLIHRNVQELANPNNVGLDEAG